MKVSSSVLLLLSIAVFGSQAIRLKQPLTSHLRLGSESRVIGGENAADGSAPYQVSLQANGYQQCGGAILNKRYIATAAHCFNYIDGSSYKVVTGTNKYNKGGKTYYVEKVIIHPKHNIPYTDHNDIALIRLNDSIVWNDKTHPIKLPTKELENGAPVLLTGWGSIEVWGDTPVNLQKVTLSYLSNKDCAVKLNNDPSFGAGHVCTTSKKGQGACHGDSGGPVVDEEGFLVALVNWGYPCALGEPDVFASALYYRDWMNTEINKIIN